MPDANSSELNEMRLSVADFWDLYATGDLVTYRRDPATGYTGSLYVEEDDSPAMLLGEQKRFTLARLDLLKFPYDDEPMFGLGIHNELAKAIAGIITMPLMADDTTPNRDQLGLVLRLCDQPVPGPDSPYGNLRQQAVMALRDASIPLEKAATLMSDLMPGEEEYESYQEAGTVSLLCAEREILLKAYAFCTTDPKITEQITAVINNHEHEDAITVQTAIWALGRHNDNAAIDSLLGLLRRDAFGFHQITIQEALQFLCSKRELIPIAGENEWKYWGDRKQRLPDNPAAWAECDAESVFWEKRLRVVKQWKAAGEESRLERLKMDEVLPVRLAAGGSEKLTA